MEETGNDKLGGNRVFSSLIQALELLVFLVLAMTGWGFLLELVIDLLEIERFTILNLLLPLLAYGTTFVYISKVKGVSVEYFQDNRNIKLGAYVKVVFLLLGYLFLLSILNYFIQLLLPIREDTLRIFNDFLRGNFLSVLLIVCVIAPVAEETIFRGLILKDFQENMRKWSAITLSALLFGVMHLNIWQGISAFFLGLLLGWLFIESGSLKLSIFAHAANNFIAFSLVRLGNKLETPENVEVTVSINDYFVVGLMGLIIVILSLTSLKKELDNNDEVVK